MMEDRAPDEPGPRRMPSEKQMLQIVPVSASTLARMEKEGRFPKSTYISPKANRKVTAEGPTEAEAPVIDDAVPLHLVVSLVRCMRGTLSAG